MVNLRYRWSWLKAEFRWRVLGKRYAVRLTEEVQKQFDELPEEAQAEIRKTMERLSRNPYTGDRMKFEALPEAVQEEILRELDEEEAEG
ncbi:unnamed protein product [marine sediment metagenome]|uniref:Uncharacterized protein n=2 Tax=marine sediment metagenome TaxID=412755 RepID=X1BJ34_9ZZZZ